MATAKAKRDEKKDNSKKQNGGAQPQPSAASAGTDVALRPGDMEVIPAGKNLPDYIKKEDRRGTENLGMADLVIPRLEIVQGLSPAIKRGDPGFIQGAQQGMMNNSVTRALYGDVVQLIPVHYMVQHLVWRDRKLAEAKRLPTDGGFFGAYPNAEEAKARAEQEGGENAAIVVIDTPTHLCLLLNRAEGKIEEIMVSMPRTKAKISRQWNTMVKLAGGPRFSRAYEVKTVLQKNPKGDFYNFSIVALGFPPKPLFDRASSLYESVSKGERTIQMDTKHMVPGGEEGGDVETGTTSKM